MTGWAALADAAGMVGLILLGLLLVAAALLVLLDH